MAAAAPITDTDLLELERLDNEASPAPWATTEDEDKNDNKVVAIDPSDDWLILATLLRMDGLDVESEMLDAEFITKARNGMAGLIARVRGAEAKFAAAAKVLEGYKKWEADIISSDDAWELGRLGHPWMTDEIYDTMMDLQHERNEVLRPSETDA